MALQSLEVVLYYYQLFGVSETVWVPSWFGVEVVAVFHPHFEQVVPDYMDHKFPPWEVGVGWRDAAVDILEGGPVTDKKTLENA